MFARASAMFLFALFSLLPLLAAAIPAPGGRGNNGGNSVSQCNTGPVQCCNSLQNASPAQQAGLAGLFGLILGPITGQIGQTCSPITAAGVGSGANCVSQPVCCQGNSFNGLIALGCSPININL